jgi:hypothetical protein
MGIENPYSGWVEPHRINHENTKLKKHEIYFRALAISCFRVNKVSS